MLMWSAVCLAQQGNGADAPPGASPEAKVKAKADSVEKKNFTPTGIRIGADMIAIGKTFLVDSYQGWELNADVDINRYFFTVDVGSWSREYNADTDTIDHYKNNGTYFRVGIDVNFLTDDPDGNMLFLGARYGHSIFSEKFVANVTDTLWGTESYTRYYENNDVTAHWFELTAGLRVKVWKMFWMGYTARYKFALGTSPTPDMLPHDVPGYGTTDKNSTWGFNYQILVRLPLPKRE